MNIIELELQKADLVREILTSTDQNLINTMLLVINEYRNVESKKEKPKKRELGFLKGKAEATFHNDWRMTPEELGMV